MSDRVTISLSMDGLEGLLDERYELERDLDRATARLAQVVRERDAYRQMSNFFLAGAFVLLVLAIWGWAR